MTSFYRRDVESWAVNPRFPWYAVSTFGRVKNLKLGKPMRDDTVSVHLVDLNNQRTSISRRVLMLDTFCMGDFTGKRTFSTGEPDSFNLFDIWAESWWTISDRIFIHPTNLEKYTEVPHYKVIDEDQNHLGLFPRMKDVHTAFPELTMTSINHSVNFGVYRKGYLVSRVQTVVSV